MTDEVLKKLSSVDLATVVAIIVMISFVVKQLQPLYIKFKNFIIKKNDHEVKEESLEKIVYQTRDRVGEYEDHRIHDRQQSREIQKELKDSINDLSDKLDKLATLVDQKFSLQEEKTNKRARAELKDSIGALYRYHESTGKWNHIEKETLEDLIEQYEEAGGDNSFVHDVVQKRMYTWEIIPLPEEITNSL